MSKTRKRKQRRKNKSAVMASRPVPAAVQGQPTPSAMSAELTLSQTKTSWSGPLPHPQELEAFDRVVPGAAERIVHMAEQEGAHVRDMERGALRWTGVGQILGQLLAFAVAAAGLFAAYHLAMANHDGAAMVIGGVPLATIVGAFLKSWSPRK